jgi:serine/threonine-protein kinase
VDDEAPGPFSPGDVVAGKYRIERVLGRGGMAVVYAAHHQLLAQSVALKVIRSESRGPLDVLQRFISEARAVARLRGEHVVRVMDVGVLDDGMPYIVMERLIGTDLARIVEQRGPLPAAIAVDYTLQVLVAIAEAHANGIIHRDLKPSNVFLHDAGDGREPVVKVLDFGIFKATDGFEGSVSAHTATGAILGTPAYLSPEQLRSSKTVDTRTDIWSVGVILYELLSGKAPFLAETLGGVFASVLERTPPPLDRLASLPPGLEKVVSQCLEKERERRFTTVADLSTALLPFATASGAARVARTRELLGTRSIAAGPESTAGTLVASQAEVAAASRPPPALQTDGSWSKLSPRRSGASSAWAFAAMTLALLTVTGFAVYDRVARPAAPPATSSGAPPHVAAQESTAAPPPPSAPEPAALPPATASALATSPSAAATPAPARAVPSRAERRPKAPAPASTPGLASDRQW